MTPGIAEQTPGVPSNFQEQGMTNRMTETMVLNVAQGATNGALDPLAPERLITKVTDSTKYTNHRKRWVDKVRTHVTSQRAKRHQ